MNKRTLSMRIDDSSFVAVFRMDEQSWNKYMKLCGDKSVHEKAKELILEKYESLDNFKDSAEKDCRSYSQQAKKIILDFLFTSP